MKKLSLVIALALVMAMTFGTAAFAAQAISNTGFGGSNPYQATPTWNYVYDNVNGGVYKSNNDPANLPSSFNPDGKTNYPYEIYLPNEENPAQYRIHTNYTKNTDACASCHATHTAVGPSLLQWYSTYETCMACHDGTVTTTYNVEEGEIGTSSYNTFGGRFGNGKDHYASQHNVQGSVSIAAAPGGSVVSDSATIEGGKQISMWTTSFGCESCHTPHGQGGNARILHPDPNGWATKTKAAYYTIDSTSGAVYKGTNLVTMIKGYPYKIVIKDASGNDITSDFKVDNTLGYSKLTVIGATYDLNDVAKVYGTSSIQVKMAITNYLGVDNSDPANPVFGQQEDVKHVAGMNSFCGACHVDYNTEAQVQVNGSNVIMGDAANRAGYGASTGVFSQAHRHSVGLDFNYGNAANLNYIGEDKLMMVDTSDKITCLTCHFAHGTSQEWWQEVVTPAKVVDSWDPDELREVAGSSALKRLPNMGTCEACHQKADANEGYAANTSLASYSENGTMQTYYADAAHQAYFAANTYKDATTCITCHASAADDVMSSVHWTVGGAASANKDFFGNSLGVKDSQVFTSGMPFGMSDRFCGFPGGAAGVSWAYEVPLADGKVTEANSCGKCHISINTTMPPLFLGFMGQTNDSMKKNIDCLACHLDVEKYDPVVNKKVAYTAQGQAYFTYGEPARPEVLQRRNTAFNIAEVGKDYKIQKPDNHNCMSCHEHAQAGPVYKRHGVFSEKTDIHAAKGITCMNCHPTSRHKIAKGLAATDLVANDRPDVEVSCTTSKCHSVTPHSAVGTKGAYIDQHTAKIACQSCHVKAESNVYAGAALDYVNEGFEEKGFATLPDMQKVRDLFKGGAAYNDFREVGGDLAAWDASTSVPGAVYGFLQTIPLLGKTEWSMVQPGNYAWRWFNGTGTGMANAIASFGFYDPYYFQDGFAGFRGTTSLPAPAGFGTNPDGDLDNWLAAYMTGQPTADFSGAGGLAGLYGMYWKGYENPAMFAGVNTFDKELYNGAPKGAQGDKIYAFRKMQAWMPVPRTNYWFLTPHDNKTMKTAASNENYESLKNAIESPMMYMFFSGMFKEAMDLYAQEFGFQYMYEPRLVTVDMTTVGPAQMFDGSGNPLPGSPVPVGFFGLYNGLPETMRSGVMELNGLVYDKNAYWLDDVNNPGLLTDDTDVTVIGTDRQYDLAVTAMGIHDTKTVPATANAAQAALVDVSQGLGTYMYFPMPLDANIMNDHAIAAKDFETDYGKYEPRTCLECHVSANNDGSGNYLPFDNPDWNPLAPKGPVSDHMDAFDWGKNFHKTVTTGGTTSALDWVTLGYTKTEIDNLTSNNPTDPWVVNN